MSSTNASSIEIQNKEREIRRGSSFLIAAQQLIERMIPATPLCQVPIIGFIFSQTIKCEVFGSI